MPSVSFSSVLKEKLQKSQVPTEFIHERDRALRSLIQQNVGIVRNNEDLEKTMQQLVLWQEECKNITQNNGLSKEYLELRNKITVAVSIVSASLKRKIGRASCRE